LLHALGFLVSSIPELHVCSSANFKAVGARMLRLRKLMNSGAAAAIAT
jgi:hypothetical protein